MKQFTDDEYVGYGKLVYDDPLCTWLAEHDLQVLGYRRILIPHIRTVGERDPKRADDTLAAELRAAGINVIELPERYGEPHSIIGGELFGWKFRRAWYYWMVHGPGIPFEAATKLHEAHGKSVRVNGDCGCSSPTEQGGGPVTSYHVDNQEGLNALAATIKVLAAASSPVGRPRPDPEKLAKFKTAHQLAKELLAGPDHMVVLPTPSFDTPGMLTAFPARVEAVKIQGIEAVAVLPDIEVLAEIEGASPDETKPPEGAPDAGHG